MDVCIVREYLNDPVTESKVKVKVLSDTNVLWFDPWLHKSRFNVSHVYLISQLNSISSSFTSFHSLCVYKSLCI